MTPEERAALAAELEAMVAHSTEVWEKSGGSAYAEALLEDLEERVLAVARQLRGRESQAYTYHHPMPEEV